VTYALGPGADQLFAKPYVPVLASLIDELRIRHGAADLVNALRSIGMRLARERLGQVAGLRGKDRVEAAARLVNDLGGLAEVEERGDSYVINGYSCPLIAVVADHPEVCQLTQAFLEGVLDGATVRECCRRGEDVACRFEIDLEHAAASPSDRRA
jgi:predicted ArsR family transcriptional regulator